MADLHLLETYKQQEDKFCLCEGRLSTDNLHVLQVMVPVFICDTVVTFRISLQPTYLPLLIKGVWLQEIWPLLQKRTVSRSKNITGKNL